MSDTLSMIPRLDAKYIHETIHANAGSCMQTEHIKCMTTVTMIWMYISQVIQPIP